ncbi:restriction endonuclease subunit S [Saccharicrinis aurantiacus]|uniref:restriction endonuclease subunit S n=1 Tax=Saccharicrinis aurantiacus TaxID=1849719 RepID=UPI00248F7F1B|nr:restriction endonuclease subunit S [Saccharicrinis aurantiacus]
MSKWESKLIGDIFKISSGGTPSRKKPEFFEGGKVPWVKTGELKGKFANKPQEYITDEALLNSSAKLFPVKTVLLAMYGATIGACSILDFEAATNQACAALLPTSECDEVYTYYYLKSIKDEIIRKGVGGAQPNISAGLIKKIQIPLPPLATQKKIAAILDQADNLRQLNKQLIAKYDALTQSLFLDMFGDPVTNPMGWEKTAIDDISTLVTKGASPKWQGFEYISSGVRFVTSENVRLGYLDCHKDKFVAYQFHEKLKRSSLKKDDLLVNLVGASIGRGALVTNHILPANINQAVAKIELDSLKVNPVFLLNQIITPQLQDRLIGNKVEGARANISLKNVRELSIYIPPIALQNLFADRIQAIEAQKAQAQQALQKSEDLFNSLLQRAFKGELVG